MVASAIAYALTAFLFSGGVWGLWLTGRSFPEKSYVFSSILLIGAAWACAHFGGI